MAEVKISCIYTLLQHTVIALGTVPIPIVFNVHVTVLNISLPRNFVKQNLGLN